VKLRFNNGYFKVLTQRPVTGLARRGRGRYGSIPSGVSGARWHLRGATQRAAPSGNLQHDSRSINEERCFRQRIALEIEEDPRGLRIEGIRELNQPIALALQKRLKAVLTEKVNVIELDLSQIVFLDSHGLGTLIALRNMMVRRKGVVRLLNPSRFVEQVLEMTRLHRVLAIVKCEGSLAG